VQLVYFDPEKWESFCQYKPLTASGSAASSSLGLVPSSSSFDALLGQCPEVLDTTVACPLQVSTHTNLPTALEQLGGVQTLLFLVAKVCL
jgi:hypothetical protein